MQRPILGWVILAVLVAGCGLGRVRNSSPAPALAADANAPVESPAQDDIEAARDVRAAAEGFYGALLAGKLSEAATHTTLEPSASMPEPFGSQRLAEVLWMGEPGLASATAYRIGVIAKWQGISGRRAGAVWGHLDRLYALRSDPEHLILETRDGPTDPHRFPATAVDQFTYFPEDRIAPQALPDFRRRALSLLSSRWAGWNADTDITWRNLQAWWGEEVAKRGPYVESERNHLNARFVGATGEAAMVDRDIYFGDPPAARWHKVTYRFTLLQSAPDASDGDSGGYLWRISGIECIAAAEVASIR